MHYIAGWASCTTEQELFRTIILCVALAAFAFSAYFLLTRLGSRGRGGLLLALIATVAVGFGLYFAAGLSIFYYLGFCQ
jgi:hypothetical protein